MSQVIMKAFVFMYFFAIISFTLLINIKLDWTSFEKFLLSSVFSMALGAIITSIKQKKNE